MEFESRALNKKHEGRAKSNESVPIQEVVLIVEFLSFGFKYGHRNIPPVQAGACSHKYVAVKRPGLLPAFEVCDLLIRVATHRRGTGLLSCRCFLSHSTGTATGESFLNIISVSLA